MLSPSCGYFVPHNLGRAVISILAKRRIFICHFLHVNEMVHSQLLVSILFVDLVLKHLMQHKNFPQLKLYSTLKIKLMACSATLEPRLLLLFFSSKILQMRCSNISGACKILLDFCKRVRSNF